MQPPVSSADFFQILAKSDLLDGNKLSDYVCGLDANGLCPNDAVECAQLMVFDGLLTSFQARLLLQGKWKNFYLANKYKVLEQLGEGGMGQVFLCEHRMLRRRVAVKILPPEKAQSEAAVQRFMREAQAVACLDHPNVIRAHDVGRHGQLYFMVLEYVEGVNFQNLVESHGRLAIPRVVNYIAQTALGLHVAHYAGVIHRDVKPANILLERSGIVKVLDLGLARWASEVGELTKAGGGEDGLLGTADYIAPEQALDPASADWRADLYSLGAVAYFLLTGHPPYEGGTVAQKLMKHQSAAIPSARVQRPEIPPTLDSLFKRMMSKNPDDRPQTSQEVYSSLLPWVTPVAPPSADELPAARYSRHSDINDAQTSTIAGQANLQTIVRPAKTS